MSAKGGPVFTYGLPGGRLAPFPPVSYATAYTALEILVNWSYSLMTANPLTLH